MKVAKVTNLHNLVRLRLRNVPAKPLKPRLVLRRAVMHITDRANPDRLALRVASRPHRHTQLWRGRELNITRNKRDFV